MELDKLEKTTFTFEYGESDRELLPLIEVGASWSIFPTEQVYPSSKGCTNLGLYQNYIANFSRFLLAFISLSCSMLQLGQIHSLRAKFFTSGFL